MVTLIAEGVPCNYRAFSGGRRYSYRSTSGQIPCNYSEYIGGDGKPSELDHNRSYRGRDAHNRQEWIHDEERSTPFVLNFYKNNNLV